MSREMKTTWRADAEPDEHPDPASGRKPSAVAADSVFRKSRRFNSPVGFHCGGMSGTSPSGYELADRIAR